MPTGSPQPLVFDTITEGYNIDFTNIIGGGYGSGTGVPIGPDVYVGFNLITPESGELNSTKEMQADYRQPYFTIKAKETETSSPVTVESEWRKSNYVFTKEKNIETFGYLKRDFWLDVVPDFSGSAANSTYGSRIRVLNPRPYIKWINVTDGVKSTSKVYSGDGYGFQNVIKIDLTFGNSNGDINYIKLFGDTTENFQISEGVAQVMCLEITSAASSSGNISVYLDIANSSGYGTGLGTGNATETTVVITAGSAESVAQQIGQTDFSDKGFTVEVVGNKVYFVSITNSSYETQYFSLDPLATGTAGTFTEIVAGYPATGTPNVVETVLPMIRSQGSNSYSFIINEEIQTTAELMYYKIIPVDFFGDGQPIFGWDGLPITGRLIPYEDPDLCTPTQTKCIQMFNCDATNTGYVEQCYITGLVNSTGYEYLDSFETGSWRAAKYTMTLEDSLGSVWGREVFLINNTNAGASGVRETGYHLSQTVVVDEVDEIGFTGETLSGQTYLKVLATGLEVIPPVKVHAHKMIIPVAS